VVKEIRGAQFEIAKGRSDRGSLSAFQEQGQVVLIGPPCILCGPITLVLIRCSFVTDRQVWAPPTLFSLFLSAERGGCGSWKALIRFETWWVHDGYFVPGLDNVK
jgi:hypothetical protein